jgi:hypothetical protein
LLAAYDATIAAYPALQARLAPMRADHAAHLEALRPSSASPSPEASPTPPGVPSDAKTAISDLASFEHEAAADRIRDIGPLPARLAQLLTSIGGSEAVHAALLTVAK